MVAANALALGTVQWGMRYGIANTTGVPAQDEVQRILECALEHGITTLDTARAYGDAEKVIGTKAAEERWRVFTKLAPDVYVEGASREETGRRARESIETSLRNLRRDQVEGLLLHRPEHRVAGNGVIWEILREFQAEGKIDKLGISAVRPEDALLALDIPDIEVIQVASSLLDQRLLRAGFFQRAAALSKRVFVRSVYLQGVAHLDPCNLPLPLAGFSETLSSIRDWAQLRNVTSADVFLAAARKFTGATILFGCETVQQLGENLLGWNLDALDGPDLDCLIEGIPDFEERMLDPSKWGGERA